MLDTNLNYTSLKFVISKKCNFSFVEIVVLLTILKYFEIIFFLLNLKTIFFQDNIVAMLKIGRLS